MTAEQQPDQTKDQDSWIKLLDFEDTIIHSRYGKTGELRVLIHIWKALKAIRLDCMVEELFYDSKAREITVGVFPGWGDQPEKIGRLAYSVSETPIHVRVRNGSPYGPEHLKKVRLLHFG